MTPSEETTRGGAESCDSVCGLCYCKAANSVTLILKNRPAWQKNRLNGVGGKIEPGETPLAAMVREWREETGHGSEPEEWSERVRLRVPLAHGSEQKRTIHFFARFVDKSVADLGYPLPQEGGEQVWWVDFSWIISIPNLLPNLTWLIPLCLDGFIEAPLTINYD